MSIFNEAKAIYADLVKDRRYIHENAEIGFDMPFTSAYVKKRLGEMGYNPVDCGQNGVLAVAGGKKPGKTFLLRADMDALPIAEENDIEFKSKTGNTHACGHDMHTAMLLGAAKILKDHEDEICGQVKLMFQPSEETLEGALAMIDAGILENPKVDAALMIHVFAGMDLPIPSGAPIFTTMPMASSDTFEITIKGKGCHGAMSHTGIDPLNVLCHAFIALQTINSREIAPNESLSLTIGKIQSGVAPNVIPDTAFMTGTLRTYKKETRELAKKRIVEITMGVAATFGAEAEVVYKKGNPVLNSDPALVKAILEHTRDLLGSQMVINSDELKSKPSLGMGSEDFSYVCEQVPGMFVGLAAGTKAEGHMFPMHHPKATFNEAALPVGAAIYANAALKWLEKTG